MKCYLLPLRRRFCLATLTAVSLGLALPAFAGTLTITSGPNYSPTDAFTNSTVTVQASHVTDGDRVSMTGDVTITPPAAGLGGSDTLSFTADFAANPGDLASAAYSFTVNSTDSRNFSYSVTGTATVSGIPTTYTDQGTITPGMHTYSGQIMASAPFPIATSGTFRGQLSITPIIQLPRGTNPSGVAAGTLAVSITQGDFQLAGGAAPTPTALQLRNISSRAMIMGGDQDAIAGFIISGSVSKRVIVRGIGPSMPSYVTGKLGDPSINLVHLTSGGAELVGMNDNWKSDQQAEITATGLAPSNDLESAIVATLAPGNYTAQLSGNVVTGSPGAPAQAEVIGSGSRGIGLIEVYDLDPTGAATVANLSTRGMVLTDDNVLIGGVILGGTQTGRVVTRAIGPSMTMVPDALADPTIELFDGNGTSIAFNDDWQTDANADQLGGLAPSNPKESALARDLAPGNYTAIVRGKDRTNGVGLVEFYLVQQAK